MNNNLEKNTKVYEMITIVVILDISLIYIYKVPVFLILWTDEATYKTFFIKGMVSISFS